MDGFHDNLADLGHLDNEHSNRDTPLMKTASSKPLLLPQMNTNVLYSNTTTTGITAKRKPSLNCRSSGKEERLTRSIPVTIQAYTEPMPKASCQCRMKLGAVDAAHSRNRPTATDEKTRKVFSVLIVISLVGTIAGKSLKLLSPYVIILKLKCTKFNFSCPGPRWESLQRSPRPFHLKT